MSNENIYKTPTSLSHNLEEMTPSELRKQFGYDEICILAVGWFYYYLGSFLIGLIGLNIWLYTTFAIAPFILAIFICTLAGFLFIIIGFGIRNFDSWARTPSILAGYTAMFFFPVGTLAGGVCVYLLHGHAIREIFSSEYQIAYAISNRKLPKFGWLALTLGLLTGLSFWLTIYILRKHFGIT